MTRTEIMAAVERRNLARAKLYYQLMGESGSTWPDHPKLDDLDAVWALRLMACEAEEHLWDERCPRAESMRALADTLAEGLGDAGRAV